MAAVWLCGATGAEGAAQSTPTFQTEVLVTAERGEAPRDEMAGTAAMLPRQEIEQLPATALPAIISFLPGFHVMFGQEFAGTPIVQARGFFGGGEVDYVQLLVDGVPVADPESGLVDWRRFRAWDVERVEARRGPSASLYGDAALGGVVQLLTRTDTPRGGGSVSGGSFGTFALDAGVSRRVGSAAATLAGSLSRSSGFRTHSRIREGGITGAVEAGPAVSRWTARAHTDVWRRQEPGPRSAAELASDRFGSDAMFNADNEEGWRGRVSVQHTRARDALLVNLTGYASVYDADRTRTVLLVPGLGDRAARSLFTTTAGASARAESDQTLAGGPIATIFGGEVARDGVEPGSRLRMGAYISERWSATSRLHLSAGLRYDRVSDDFDEAGTPTHQAWSPRAGVAYEIARTDSTATTAFVQAARAFKVPTLNQLFDPRRFPDFAGGSFLISNPDLEPQRTASVEAGIRQTVGPSRFEVAAYRIRVEDEIDFDPQSFTYANIGRTRHDGIEFEAQWRQHARVSASLVYAWTKVEPIDSEGAVEQLKNIPRHLWRPTLALELPAGLSAGVAYTRTAGKYLDDANAFPLNDQSSIDIRFGKAFRSVRATLDLLNVTDDRFEEMGFSLSGFDGGQVPYYFPGAGFAARAGLEVSF